MLIFNLPLTWSRLFASSSFVRDETGLAQPLVVGAAMPEALSASPVLVSAYEDPPPDLDQRVRALGEW